eukprot:1393497-Amorphochlora_amoeboformis.AAC.1
MTREPSEFDPNDLEKISKANLSRIPVNSGDNISRSPGDSEVGQDPRGAEGLGEIHGDFEGKEGEVERLPTFE